MSLVWGDIQNLVTANLSRVGDSTVDGLIPLWANVFQQKVQHDRNYWFLKATATRLIDSTAQSYTLPPGFKDSGDFYLVLTLAAGNTQDSYYELKPITEQDVVRIYQPFSQAETNTHGRPCHYLMNANSMTVYPWPDAQYTMGVTYWRDIDPPVAGSPNSFTNYWIQVYPQLYEMYLTHRGFLYLEQFASAKEWLANFDMEIKNLRAEHNARVMKSESALIPHSDVYSSTQTDRGFSSWIESYYD